MNSWLVWGGFVIAGVFLGWVGYHFTVRTLRFVTLAFVAVAVLLVTGYGTTHPARAPTGLVNAHPARAPTDLVNAFIRGVDQLSGAFFQPLLPGHGVFVPGRFGWLVLIAVFVFAYRELEVWAMRWQPPTVDTSALGGSERDARRSSEPGGEQDEQSARDELAAELRFRLPAVEVRAPSILPGGAMPSGLASIAENSGVTGGGFAGAVIRVAGMLWPTPRQYRTRVWVKLARSPAAANSGDEAGQRPGRAGQRSDQGEGRPTAGITVTVDIEDPRTGGRIATKTLAARNLDDAAARVAAYVARQIFREDLTVPPWSIGSFDGGDLAALLRAKQAQELIYCPDDARKVRCRQIDELKDAVRKSPGAGVARYELALLDDLEGCHLEALWLHAINRKQYPRFFRGRYRLGMSLEMIANPEYPWGKEPPHKLTDSLEILDQCRVTGAGERNIPPDELPPPGLRKELLAAAMAELCACQGQLTLWRLIWETFQHRDERAIRRPYLRLGERQRFQDGCRVAELLVAVRQRLIGQEPGQSRKDPPWTRKLRRSLRKAMHITDIITGDITAIEALLGMSGAGQQKWPPDPYAGKKRWLPWQHRTPSWEAAYNAACLYAALYDACADENEQSEMAEMALRCLDRVVNDRLCEMERPWDWIFTDPDLRCLKKYPRFRNFLDKQKRNDYPEAKPGLDPLQLSGPQRRERTATEAGSSQPH